VDRINLVMGFREMEFVVYVSRFRENEIEMGSVEWNLCCV
jgi:hypothetical protein